MLNLDYSLEKVLDLRFSSLEKHYRLTQPARQKCVGSKHCFLGVEISYFVRKSVGALISSSWERGVFCSVCFCQLKLKEGRFASKQLGRRVQGFRFN